MGMGTNIIRDINPQHAELIDNLKEQLLIVFLKRLGGKVSIPVEEVDDTSQDLFLFYVDSNNTFHFRLEKKQ